jgi:hypothetical protein
MRNAPDARPLILRILLPNVPWWAARDLQHPGGPSRSFY